MQVSPRDLFRPYRPSEFRTPTSIQGPGVTPHELAYWGERRSGHAPLLSTLQLGLALFYNDTLWRRISKIHGRSVSPRSLGRWLFFSVSMDGNRLFGITSISVPLPERSPETAT